MEGRRERNKRIKKERILKAAIEHFTQRGFEQTSIESITRRAGVAKGTFYNFFKQKEDVLLYFLDKEIDLSRQEIQRTIHTKPTILEQLELLIVTYLKNIFKNREFSKVLVRERVCKIGTGKNRNELVLMRTIRELLEKAQHRGEIKQSVDLSRLEEIVFAIFTMYTIYWLNGFIVSKKQCVRRIRDVLNIFFEGAGSTSDKPQSRS
ncbi:MAG: TetR/AcrR family transcriptional regulator [Desulfobacterota bacterium]|nr:TetR/AcrR family transcriptional regulator [Thermodesulfobacteriota bacterium]